MKFTNVIIFNLFFTILFTNFNISANEFSKVQRPNFSQTELTFINHQQKILKKIKVEVAKSSTEHQYGLMNITKLQPDAGMLFVFNEEQILSFWMKNTLIDLSIAYIDKNLAIVDIQEMKATNSLQVEIPTYPSKKPAQYALEMNTKWFLKNKISIGDKIKISAK